MGYGKDVRHIKAEVKIDYTSPFIDQYVEATSNGQNNIAMPNQVADGIKEMGGKYLTLDGTCRLDGNYQLHDGDMQVGYFSSQLAKEDGTFDDNPILTLKHTARPIQSISITGDDKREEYPIDCDVRLYGTDGLLKTIEVRGNDLIIYFEEIEATVGVVKHEFEFITWSKPFTNVKICEVLTSIQETYTEGDIFLMSVLEESEVKHSPIGTVASAELFLKIYNENKKFDAGNVGSKLHGVIKPNRRIRPSLKTTYKPRIYDYKDVVIGDI